MTMKGLIAHLHMRIVKIQRVGQSARILPIHVKEGDIREKSTSFLKSRKRQAKVTRINKISYLFRLYSGDQNGGGGISS